MRWGACAAAISLVSLAVGAPSPSIQPGDILSLNCADDPTWSVRRTIASDGTISLPLAGTFAVGTTVSDARQTIESKLAGVGYPFPVEVALVGSRRRVVSVTGAVTRAIDIPWRQGLTLADAVTQACDLPPSSVVITDSLGRTIAVDLPSGASIPLRLGDRVSVPLSDHSGDIVLVGAFGKPGAIRMRPGMTLAQAIAEAGGLALDADPTTMTIQTKSESPVPAQGSETVSPGMVVRVYQHRKAGLVSVGGRVSRSGPYRIRPGVSLLALLRLAGWEPVEGAMVCTIGHLRQGRIESATFDLQEIVAGKREEPLLFPGDSVVVGA